MTEPAGVVVTGAYGTGKSSVVEEMAGILEDAGTAYAAIDLDWLLWFDSGLDDAAAEQVFLANLAAVAGNYLAAGVDHFLMAGAVSSDAALTAVRSALPFPMRVVRLTLGIAEIRARLASAVTAGREDDLLVAERWLAEGVGVTADVEVANDRPIREVATEILGWLGWR